MAQDLTGGYCPRCDTVWASPGVCRCDPFKISKDEMDKAVEAYRIIGIDKAMDKDLAKDQVDYLNEKADDRRKIWSDHASSVFETEIWNKAIEAAVSIVQPVNLNLMPIELVTDIEKQAYDVRQIMIEQIRKLKR